MGTQDTELKLCNAEISLQLKEVGFDWKCDYNYDSLADLHHVGFINHNSHKLKYSAPTQALAIKWFRDIHKVDIIVDNVDNTREFYYDYSIIDHIVREYHDEDCIDQATRKYDWDCEYNTYELAEEAGILRGIEILKSRNNIKK